MKTTILAALTALCLPAIAHAHDGKIEVTEGYARSSNPKTAAAFMTIFNDTHWDCTLTGIATDAADKAELHTNRENAQGMMAMLPLSDGIAIPAGETHALARGGDHVMLMGLTRPLAQGDEIALALDFGDCGTLDVVLPLDNDRKPGESGAAPMDHGAHSSH